MLRSVLFMTALGMLTVCGLSTSARAQLAAGDRAWDARAEQVVGRLATPDRIEEAINSYRAACESEANPLVARWKLLRALHYLSEFSTAAESRKSEAVEEGASSAAAWSEGLADDDGSARDRAQLYFWAAINWGARGQRVGLLTIVREGVAGRIHEYAERAVALYPEIERGGGYRLLSRLHASLPRVPFVSGWVDREQAVPLAERASAIDPSDPGNRLVLALALLERAPARRAEARALLEGVTQHRARPALLVEDQAIREEARQRLAALASGEESGEARR